MKSVVGDPIEIETSIWGNRGCCVGNKRVRGRDNLDAINESDRVLVGFELEGESGVGDVKEVLFVDKRGVVIDREVMQEDKMISLDSENRSGEIVGRMREREEVKTNPESTHFGNIESVGGFL